ncbi:MAG: flippase [Methanobacterium sp.]
MNTTQKIFKNTGVLFLSQIFTFALAFFYTMYSARYLGAEGFGLISFALAFAGIIQIVTDMGLNTLLVREVARDKSVINKYLRNIATIKILLGIITILSCIMIIYIMGYGIEIILIVSLVTFYFIFTSFSYMFYSLFQAHHTMEFQSIGDILNSTLLFSGMLIAIYFDVKVLGFAFIYFMVGAIVFGYSLSVYIKKFTLPKIEIDLKFWKKLIIEALPLSLALIFSTMAFRIDTVFLSFLQGSLIVGWYSAAYRLMEVLIFIPTVFIASIYPLFSNYYIHSQDSLKNGYIKSFKYLNILGLPIAIGITLIAPEIINLIYGTGYTESIIALQILIWTIPFIFLTHLLGAMFISINKQHLLLKIIFITMAFNIIFNLIFIPIYSYIGSSVITIFTELSFFILAFYYISKLICKIDNKIIIKPLVASLIMGLFIYLVNVNVIFTIIMAILVYFLALFLLKAFSTEDYDLIRELVKKTKKN